MKHLLTTAALFVLLLVSFRSAAQTLVLTGPASASYCDLENVNFFAYAAMNDPYGSPDWRFKFSWYRDGTLVYLYTDELSATSGANTDNLGAVSGTIQVKLEREVKFGATWIVDQTHWSNSIVFTLSGITGSYEASNTANRMVSGDFDNDGKEDDVAAIYDGGSLNMAIQVWTSDGGGLTFQTTPWYTSSSFESIRTSGKVVSGDFDNDGRRDDIAALYDYGGNHTEIHVWLSNGSSFSHSTWWVSGYGGSGYNALLVTGRVVAGDFNNDGIDDICALYDTGLSSITAHLFLSSGSSFSFNVLGWYSSGPGNIDASKIIGKVVAGDFDNDGYEDDITAFYEYPGSETKAFVWKSTGSSLGSPSNWYSSGVGNFDASKITGRVVSGDFDRDGFRDDITALYQYSGASTTAFVWKSNGTSFGSTTGWYSSGAGNFDATMVTGRIVAGDFDNDTKYDDVTMLYNLGDQSCRFFTLESNVPTSSAFTGPYTMWEVCNPVRSALAPVFEEKEPVVDASLADFATIYPNPTSGLFSIQLQDDSHADVEVTDVSGKRLLMLTGVGNRVPVDLTGAPQGMYYVRIVSDGRQSFKKLVVK